MESTINKLIDMDENEWLEFKCCWYEEKEGDTDDKKRWGEFLKDFSALFNTNPDIENKKYLIIGFDENTGCQDYYLDKLDKKITVFNDIFLFKNKIIKKLKNHFQNIPIYKNSRELPIIDELFEIREEVINGKKLLIFIINNSPYLLEIKKQLIGNETFREGNIITRRLKKDNSPEIINAGFDEKERLIALVEKNKIRTFPEKERTIKKIVEVFRNKELPPSSTLNCINSEKSYSSGEYFEIYKLRSKHIKDIDFLYYPKFTSLTKVFELITKNRYLEYSGKKIVLVDEKNKQDGKTNKELVKERFEKKFHQVEVFSLEKYAEEELYREFLINSEIFHQGNFGVGYVIQPYTNKSNVKTVDLLLNEWYENLNRPLMVIKGIGGIGKTTVVKKFLDNLIEKKTNPTIIKPTILFISFSEIINQIMKNPKIEDIFDFYKIFAEKNEVDNIFDKNSLELCMDDGNLIVVLDGLDEVIAKTSSKFDINKFLNSVYSDYIGNFAKTKILITCRDYFWDTNTIEFDIETMQLKAFTEDMTKQYFDEYIKLEEKSSKKYIERKSKEAMTIAKEFSIEDKNNGIRFVPYILDMIKDNILTSISSSQRIESDILRYKDNINDFLVAKSCEREIKKLQNLSIDNQIEIFIDMMLQYGGILHVSHLRDFLKNKIKNFSISLENKFKEHPLLKYNSNSELLTFRYDFFNTYFKNIYLAIFLEQYKFEKIDEKTIKIILEISYDGSFIKDLILRLSNINYEELKLSISTFLGDEIYDIDDIDEEKIKRLNSSLFTLLLLLQPEKEIKDRTDLLKEIYDEKNDNTIRGLSMINIHHTNSKLRPLFNFSDLTFEDCHFENYPYFSECKFNENTFFKQDIDFIAPLHRDGINTSIRFNNINSDNCSIEGIVDVLKKNEEEMNKNDSKLRNDLKQVVKFFWGNSTFRQKVEEEMNKKLRDYSNIIKILKKEKILIPIPISTKQKRNDTAYNFSTKYLNLRKIMEENETCNEFEEMVKILEEKM